jgi:hypothetical protein
LQGFGALKSGDVDLFLLMKPLPIYSASASLSSLLQAQKPFILSQCFQDIPAITRWQPSYLQRFSSQPIEFELSRDEGYGERHEMTLGEYLTLLAHPLPCRIYMAQFPLFERIPELRKDVITPLVKTILGYGEVYSTSTWIGKRTLTPLHHDPRTLTNLFVQVCGRKEFRLFEPGISREKLRLGEGILKNTSSVDVWREDIGDGWEGVVETGDGLIVPKGWWHSVRNERDEMNISVNWWFKLNDT